MTWTQRLLNDVGPGIYVAPGTDADLTEVAARGWQLLRADLSAVTDKAGLLTALAAAIEAPEHFGHNWDALVDVWTDLAWLEDRNRVVVLDGCGGPARACPADWAVALDIVRGAVAEHQASSTTLRVVLRDTDPLSGLAAL